MHPRLDMQRLRGASEHLAITRELILTDDQAGNGIAWNLLRCFTKGRKEREEIRLCPGIKTPDVEKNHLIQAEVVGFPEGRLIAWAKSFRSDSVVKHSSDWNQKTSRRSLGP